MELVVVDNHSEPEELEYLRSVIATYEWFPIRLVAFDELSPGADPAVPLRGAEIEAVSPAASPVILSFLRAQQGAYAPSVTTSARDTSGPAVITVWFQAPGLIGAGPR